MATALIILAEGFEEIEALAPTDILRRGGVTVTLAGLTAARVTGAHGITVLADAVLNAGAAADALILPGGMPGSLALGNSPVVEELARRQIERGGIVAAICAAPVKTLGRWGLLARKRATCFPGCETEFPPDVAFATDDVVVDGKIITSRGPGTAMAFGFQILAALADPATADELRKNMACG
ncbi:DJ-1 family protein [Planctomycetales bacterium]|nr:DJ-1 family protein [Planctomycetales bacterium]GHS97469.1 DJ-1 family protein [Planctomycetales bacterium]